MHPVETYLTSIREIHSTGGGTKEESYYAALEQLINDVGRDLKPKVRCVSQLKNVGAGEPDFGLYTANQFQRAEADKPIPGQLPERGAVEVKGWNEDVVGTSKGSQVTKYLEHYGLVLVTNYRDFVLLGRDESGNPSPLESYSMAHSADGFVGLQAHPHKTATEQGDRMVEFLRRVLLHLAPLKDPEDLAWFLASYAREARYRVEKAADLPALTELKSSLEDALGMKFEGEKGEHFFRATLVQTLFYGVFSSWVLWARENPRANEHFDWRAAGWTLHVPMVKSLFDQIATPRKLKPLEVDEVLNWAGAALNRVDRDAFFRKFEEEHAVQYFYEPFLKAYDPQLRKDLGVWYTPPEIVEYQVERVDRVLREDLDLADGLADERVVILDPCCGTGAYLVETLKRIHKTLAEKSKSALTAQKLKKAAIERVFGFEILPAPFVVAHLQLGLMLRRLGAPFDVESDERAGVYLTNALTGWEPPQDPKTRIAEAAGRTISESKGVRDTEQSLYPGMPELVEEVAAARAVKRDKKILVIIGNPPYNAFAGTSPEEEGGLVDAYKEGLTTSIAKGGWGIKKFNLDDLYVRFFRVAERRIAKTGMGVVSFISNYSYLGDPSFVVMRKRLLKEFDELWFDCMNGDSRETGKLTPDGEPDPSVFSTETTKVGIRVGTAICVLVRNKNRAKAPSVRFLDYWGVTKRRDLIASIKRKNVAGRYKKVKPSQTSRFSFRPSVVGRDYAAWPLVPELAKEHHNGPVERRGFAMISIDKKPLEFRMRKYFDRAVSNDEIQGIYPALMMTGNRIVGPAARAKLLCEEIYSPSHIVRYPFKPFDMRWCYLANIRPLFSEPSPRLLAHAELADNAFFITRDTADKRPEGAPFLFSPTICDYDSISGHARHFPVRLNTDQKIPKDVSNGQRVMEEAAPYQITRANLSSASRDYLKQLGMKDPDSDADTAALIWMHALAIGYSPAYLAENADGIRQDWPRIPLPATKKALLASAELGRRVAALLDTETGVKGVTTGKVDPRLTSVAVVSRVGNGSLNPTEGHLDITAGWGHGGKGGVCMPGKGTSAARKQTDAKLASAFGDETLDIYLNGVAYWANVPKPVWEYYIGGYQVAKKWLSYREKTMLGRGLATDEAEYFTEMCRRIAGIILLQSELDANYEAIRKDTWPWPGAE